MLGTYIAASTVFLVVKPLFAAVFCLLAMSAEESAFYTMLATWTSVVAIGGTGVVAILAIIAGNRDKRNDRSIAALHTVMTTRFKELVRVLFPFGDADSNRIYHYDSWHICWSTNYTQNAVNVFTGAVLLPVPSGEFTTMLVELLNMFEEVRIQLHYRLVEAPVVLDSISLVVMNAYYVVQPLLAEIEDDSGYNFNEFRQFAAMSQAWLKAHNPKTDSRFLTIETADRKR